ASLPACDVVVIESTYGDRMHEDLETRRTMMKTDTSGMVVIPVEAMKRDFTVVEITPPHRPMVQLLFRAGRPASLLTDQKEYSGRDFDALLGPGGRDTSPLNIIIPAKNP
ncbi:MAG: hypothetical protein AAB229_03925, partial [Candidatus Hydrogenedentota bacterium]